MVVHAACRHDEYKKKIQENIFSREELIKFNARGQVFLVAKKDLKNDSVGDASYFHGLLSANMNSDIKGRYTSQTEYVNHVFSDAYFVNCNPVNFGHVIRYAVDTFIDVHETSKLPDIKLEILKKDFDYFLGQNKNIFTKSLKMVIGFSQNFLFSSFLRFLIF